MKKEFAHLDSVRVRKPADFTPISEDILRTTIIPQFEKVVERQPDRTAIKGPERSLTYRQLNNAINRLAHEIIRLAGPDRSPVAILLENDTPLMVAALAGVKSARPYIMLYPGNSVEDLRFHLTDSGASILVTSPGLMHLAGQVRHIEPPPQILVLDALHVEGNVPNPEYNVPPNAPFAIYYTSGSTGKPKGALDGHLAKSHSVFRSANRLLYSPSDRVSLITSPWHAAAMGVVIATITTGGTLCPHDVSRNSAQDSLAWLTNEQITILWCAPSLWRSILGSAPDGKIFPSLRMIRLAGEATTNADVELFKAHTAEDCILTVGYVSSEAQVVAGDVIYHDTPPFRDFVPGGFPHPEVEVLILDEEGRILKPGQVGEICVSSPYLSLGYWNNPELTARIFVPHPRDPQKRLCHTGDVGRLRDDGALEVLGRKDTQVKIRGFRVQLEAVDRELQSLEGVADAATRADQRPGRGLRLVAYVAMKPGHQFSASRLRAELSARLPGYAVPSLFIQLDPLPRTATGKISRTELPPPSHRRPDLDQAYVAPRSPVEAQIASIWEGLLGLQAIGVDDNYFELGGDSLSAVEMTLEVERLLQKAIPASFFDRPTVGALAALMTAAETRPTAEADFVLASHRGRGEPLRTRTHRRLSAASLHRRLARSISAEAWDQVVDRLVARYIVGKRYEEAVDWAIRWSSSPWVLGLLYRRRARLFARFIHSLQGCLLSPAELFPMNVLTNLSFGLKRFRGKKITGTGVDADRAAPSRFPYWRTLRELLASTPAGQLPSFVQVQGADYLKEAYSRGKGVILVSFHGLPDPARLLPVERWLELGRTATISYHTPRRQSIYRDREKEVPDDIAQTFNTEIALFAQRRLQEGKVIQILSDTHDLQGRTYGVSIANRAYQLKAGFAELALNSGAAVVPHWRHYLSDGSLQYEIGAPFTPGNGDRGRQIEDLLRQYAAFVENTWAAHPEAMRWRKMRRHLKRPTDQVPL